jgi:hypothetical protein
MSEIKFGRRLRVKKKWKLDNCYGCRKQHISLKIQFDT